jgi:hypothetical protein
MKESSDSNRQRENKMRMIVSEHLKVMGEPHPISYVPLLQNLDRKPACRTQVRYSVCDG